ncbi:MAG TPA: hypothetical protein EYP78_00590, partial [Candidatus Omnitrophica bacterium]|nr:hypothetical protein [Candidatus Omnitrophota bacterium]
IQRGASLTEAMSYHPEIFSQFHLRMVEVGERSGNLAWSLSAIGENIDRNARLQTRLITGFIYPVILIHAAIFIPAVPVLFLEGFIPFLKGVLTIIIPFYGVIFLVWLLIRVFNRIYPVKRIFHYFFSYIPLSGGLMRRLAIMRFVRNLNALYSAGENVIQATKTAAVSCGNIPLKEAILKILPEIERGESITNALKKVRFLPHIVKEMLASGEESGRIDAMLTKVGDYCEAEYETLAKRLIILLPLLVYFLVMFYIAYIIISFYAGYFTQIENLFGGF